MLRIVISGLPWVRDSHGDSYVYGYGMGMGTVMNPHGPVGILWGFLNGCKISGNALNIR